MSGGIAEELFGIRGKLDDVVGEVGRVRDLLEEEKRQAGAQLGDAVRVLERQADVAELEAIDRILDVVVEPISERQAAALRAQENALLDRRRELVSRLWPALGRFRPAGTHKVLAG